MRKPFISLKTPKDFVKLALCLALCIYALSLFLAPDESIAVFAGGNEKSAESLYGLIGSLL